MFETGEASISDAVQFDEVGGNVPRCFWSLIGWNEKCLVLERLVRGFFYVKRVRPGISGVPAWSCCVGCGRPSCETEVGLRT